MVDMPSRPPINFPTEQRRLEALGERLRLARKRRRFAVNTLAARAGISRQTLYNVENGDPSVTLGTYLRVLAVLGLDRDVDKLAADDPLGRQLQDRQLEPKMRP
jgi:transcriptional regulator with XRE-family HTH domain